MLRCPPLRDRVYRSHSTFRDLSLHGRGGRYKAWTEERMERATKAVISEGFSVRHASEEFNVPKSTLGDRVSGRVMPGSNSGPQRYLTTAEEVELVQFLTRVAAIGYGKTRKEVLAIVQNIIDEKCLNKSVTNGWWETFCRRNPSISLRAPTPLSMARAKATDPDVICRYFDLLERTLDENNLRGKPSQIFNMDESGMPLDPKAPRIVAERGSDATAIGSGNKSQVTIVACVSAAGFCMPPMVIFDRKVLVPELTEGEVEGTLYGLSAKGWMDRELFGLWFKNHFLSYIPSVRPILLLMDGHSSHYCPSTIRLAAQEQVILFALPPNTTHLSQPLDKGCFGPLKVAWREECHSYLARNSGRVITRYQFSSLFRKAWLKSMSLANIAAGFRVTGIYPVNRNALSPIKEKADSLTKETGLSFIPLYSPSSRRPLSPALSYHDLSDIAESPSVNHDPDDDSFTVEETTLFQTRYENGYDISGDERYEQWLSKYHPNFVRPLEFHSASVAKYLTCPPPVSRAPNSKPKSCGRVLTSAESMKVMEEKQRLKERKDEAKREREEARKKKQAMKLLPGKGRQTRLRGRTTSKLTEPKNRDKQQILSSNSNTLEQDTEEEDEPCGHVTQRDETVTQFVPTHSSPELDNTEEDRTCLPNLTSGIIRSTARTTRAVTSAKARSGMSSQQTRSQSLRRGRTAQRELSFGQESNDDPCGRKKTVTQRDKTVTQPTQTKSSPELDNTEEGRTCLPNLTSGVIRSTARTTRAVTSAKAPSGGKKQLTQKRSDPNQLCPAGLSNCVSGHCSHPRSVYWVQCGRCDLWYHCRCVEILPQKARQPDFSFICCL